uniref:Uncharacterized protein n=1 Tax=Graphocephala atropunctata TaxID=36148 RepID=A0A1B6KPW6_9HEMI
MLWVEAAVGMAFVCIDIVVRSTRRRRGVGADHLLEPGSRRWQHNQTQVDAAEIRAEFHAPALITREIAIQTDKPGVWFSPITTLFFPAGPGRNVRPIDVVPRVQHWGRHSGTEVRLRPRVLEGRTTSEEIISRGVGTHRCVHTQTRDSDTNDREILYQLGMDNVRFVLLKVQGKLIEMYRWVNFSEPEDADPDID